MNNNTAWLKDYLHERVQVQHLAERIAYIRSRAEAPRTANLTGMPHGGTPCGIDDQIATLGILEDELHSRQTALIDKSKALTRALLAVDDVTIQTAYELRYFDLLTPKQIAYKMGYSVNGINSIFHRNTPHLMLESEQNCK